jgi:hypothetical protein
VRTWAAVQVVVGWLHLLPSLAAFVACGWHLRRSPWVGVLMAGFGAQVATGILYRVGYRLMNVAVFGIDTIELLFVVTSVVGLLASCAVAAGVIGLLVSAIPSPGSGSRGPANG